MKFFSNLLRNVLWAATIFIFTANISISQNLLSGAESVAFDSLNNRYMVTSFNNSRIISLDKNGNQTLFKEGVKCLGNCIKDSILYVTAAARIIGYSLTNGDVVLNLSFPGVQQLGGLTTDNEGCLYAVENIQRDIYKIDLSDKSYVKLVDNDLAARPQDIIFDKFNNRVLVCFWSSNSPVVSADIYSGELDTLVITRNGWFDGITIDGEGNVYLSSHNEEGRILMFNNNFSSPEAVISSGYHEPAELDFNQRDNILAIPTFSGNDVHFLKMPQAYIHNEFSYDADRGHAPLTVNFTDQSVGHPEITNWEWDFNNDGIIDSYEQHPQWTYTDPGEYYVSLTVYSDSFTVADTLAESFKVFNGESALEFFERGSNLSVSDSLLNLEEEWTIEAWINPSTLNRKMLLDKSFINLSTNRTKTSSFNANSLGIKLVFDDGSSIYFSTPDSSLKVDEWQHLAISYNYGNELFAAYINGESVQLSASDSLIFQKELRDNSDDPLILGNSSSLVREFQGAVDEFRVWNNFRTREEVESSMLSYLDGNEAGLSLYMKFNEGSGEITENSAPLQISGTIDKAEFVQGIDFDKLISSSNGEKRGYRISYEFRSLPELPESV